ncbi:hypothetical protein [Faucicola atlantae]|uniref:hypothetical protein n=1 Tax=Faucicola atlantae TaxID=34059 RepID=UPI0025B2398D|nr:hypothetical protein [Moraxella atlantae]
MKKLLALVPMVAVLGACTSTNVAQPSPAQIQAVQDNSVTYRCDNNTQVTAFYNQNTRTNGLTNGSVNLKVTAPMLTLNDTAMLLKQDPNTVGGNRYQLANRDGSTVYTWTVDGSSALLNVVAQGQQFNFACAQ